MKKSKSESLTECAVTPRLELIGNTKCIIDGLKSIIEYTKGKIKVNVGKYNVTITGDDLYINSFTCEGASVEGTIIEIGFEGNA